MSFTFLDGSTIASCHEQPNRDVKKKEKNVKNNSQILYALLLVKQCDCLERIQDILLRRFQIPPRTSCKRVQQEWTERLLMRGNKLHQRALQKGNKTMHIRRQESAVGNRYNVAVGEYAAENSGRNFCLASSVWLIRVLFVWWKRPVIKRGASLPFSLERKKHPARFLLVRSWMVPFPQLDIFTCSTVLAR